MTIMVITAKSAVDMATMITVTAKMIMATKKTITVTRRRTHTHRKGRSTNPALRCKKKSPEIWEFNLHWNADFDSPRLKWKVYETFR